MSDGLLALVVGVIAQLSLWLEWTAAPVPPATPLPVAVLVMVLMVVPLAWRRVHPYAVLWIITAVLVVASAVQVPGLGWTVNAWAVSFYSAGVYGSARWRTPVRIITLTAFMGTIVYQFIVLPQAYYAASPNALLIVPILANLLVGGAMWWFSDEVRVSREREVQLAARTVQLEQERELNARRAVLDERVRIARELHDVVAHHVSLMGVQAGAARRVLLRDPAQTEAMLNAIEQTSREAVTELQRLLGFLRREEADGLAPQPSLRHLDALLAQMQEAGLPVTLTVKGETRPLPPGVDLSAYRIVQEALTNVVKHAGPAHAAVTLHYGPDALDIEVADDGCAAPRVAPPDGNGLRGMRERASLLGGSLRAGPQPGAGFTVWAHLPLAARPA
ncbi:MAG: sensor histidine kinase [Thermomicrobiales bacterium]